jgi:AraC family ethanolamine operon transcriptional activator
MVRRQLLAASGGAALVKSIALSHGFWHLGRFAQDYRVLFGEPPSATLELGRKQTTPWNARPGGSRAPAPIAKSG